MEKNLLKSIRIGTLVDATLADPAGYIAQILPHGFESFELTFGHAVGDIDLPRLADRIQSVLQGSGAVISAIGVYGNPLEDTEDARRTRDSWYALLEHAAAFGSNIVAGFTGRLKGQSIDVSIPRFTEIFEPIADEAGSREIKIVFENCSMGGTWNEGDWNIAHGPDAWSLMFDALPHDCLGLEWEPCHQMVNLIDPLPQLREWIDRIYHLHGKCATIHWDTIRKYGIGSSKPFVFHRTPGFGDTNWTDVFSDLRAGGFTGAIDIEGWHDPVYRDELEMTGQVYALNYLKRCRGGDFIENPSTD